MKELIPIPSNAIKICTVIISDQQISLLLHKNLWDFVLEIHFRGNSHALLPTPKKIQVIIHFQVKYKNYYNLNHATKYC